MSAPDASAQMVPQPRSSVANRNRRPPPAQATVPSNLDGQFADMQLQPGQVPPGYPQPAHGPGPAAFGAAGFAPAVPNAFVPPTVPVAHTAPVAHHGPPHGHHQTQPMAAAPRPIGQPSTQAAYHGPNVSAGNMRKLDPRTLPNPSSVPFHRHKIIYNTSTFGNPPPAYSKYFVDDRGSCSPRFMRSTLMQVPNTNALLSQSNIPLAIVVQPLADVGHEEEEVPLIDAGEKGPLRCGRCSAYINPFVRFIENGRAYSCPFCSTQNEVPDEYFSPIEANGYRRDIADRFELWRGSVDFIAPPDYVTRSAEHSEAPVILFLIDTSTAAINSGLLKAFVNATKQILESNFAEDSNTLFGFITFNKSIQFWRLDPTLQMVMVPHLQHIFTPLPPSYLLANYSTQRPLIDAFFNEVQSTFGSQPITESCLGAAVNAAMLALGKRGGRIVCLQSSLPNHGPGALKTREDATAYGKDAEKALYLPTTKFYSTLGLDCSKRFIQIDLISCGAGYSDLATLSELPRATGGHLYYIPGFNIEAHEEKLYYDLYRVLTRTHGSEAIGRLRTSEGLSVDSYLGHFSPGDGDIEMAGVDADQTLAITLKYDGNIEEKKDAFVQFAMVHTDSEGRRLIRVHTLAMHTTNVISSVFKSSDMSAVLDVLLRKTVANLGKETVAELRKEITGRTASILASYRKHCTKSDRGDAQLILPEALKLLPVHVLGAIKNILLSNPVSPEGHPSVSDARIYMAHVVQSAALETLVPMLYPRIYGLHKLHRQLELERLKDQNKAEEQESEEEEEEHEGDKVPLPGDEDYYGTYWLPGLVRASASELEPSGVYLMDDGISIYLAMHPPIDPNIFGRLFNEQGQLVWREDDELSRRLWNILQAIRFRRPVYQPFFYFDTQTATPHRRVFYSRFVEDGSDEYTNKDQIATLYKLGYPGYLCHVHMAVQDKI